MKNNILDLIKNSQNIVILAHEKPDGDAVGSSLTIYSTLLDLNKTVDIILQDVPTRFKFLKNYDKIQEDTDKFYDLGIILDCSKQSRIGDKSDIFSRCKKTICIDHHATNENYCTINYVVPETSSCCQVIYYLYKDLNIPVDKQIGESLLLGLLTDTNGYANNNVDGKTLKMAEELTNLGVEHYKIYSEALRYETFEKYELDKIARDRLTFYADGKIAYTYITKKDMENTNACEGDHEGLVEIGRNISGVEVSIFVREDDGYRFSLRSNGKVDVSEIANMFNGGGHKMAAGGNFTSNYEETINNIINEIKKRV